MAPSAYLKNIYYDNMIYRLDTIKYLIGLGGIDHIMVGTDYPYDLGDWDAAKNALIARGMLNKAGAITTAGRNACPSAY